MPRNESLSTSVLNEYQTFLLAKITAEEVPVVRNFSDLGRLADVCESLSTRVVYKAVTNELHSWYTKCIYSARKWTNSLPKRSALSGVCCHNYHSSSRSPDHPRQYQMKRWRLNRTMTGPCTGHRAEQFHFRLICLDPLLPRFCPCILYCLSFSY